MNIYDNKKNKQIVLSILQIKFTVSLTNNKHCILEIFQVTNTAIFGDIITNF